ncbi:hypothetical protein B7494_g8214 [Chlorociboria aeruginascens]|nr:hypothetical protein B7494_g8214 [Chlorociboria aeruginascens]
MALFDIRDERYRALWSEAITDKEHATTAFWSYWFRRDRLFRGDDWNIPPEAPPAEISDRRRVDLLINKWFNGKWHTICFFEAKKGTAGIPDIQEVEQQAFTACQAWLMDNHAREMYAMTAFGISAKLWYTTLDTDYLLPMVPATGYLSDKESYISAASSDAYLLRHGFETIIKNPAGLPATEVAVLKSNSTPPKTSLSTQYYADPNPASPTPSGSMYTPSAGVGFSASGFGGFSSVSSGYNPQPAEAPSTDTNPTLESLELLPDDARQVEVMFRIDEENRYHYRYEYEGQTREAEYGEWVKRRTVLEGHTWECYLNTRNNGLNFWTWTLDLSNLQRFESKKGDSKHKGKHRAH